MKLVFVVSAAFAQANGVQVHDPLTLKITAPGTGFLGLATGHNECSCNFDRGGSCGCDATLEFMNCIAQACENPKCDCQGNSHFLGACHQIGSECPHAGLQCFADNAKCVVPTVAEKSEHGDDPGRSFENEPVMSTEAASDTRRLPKLHAEAERLEKLDEELSKEEAAEREEKAAKEEKEETQEEEEKEQAALKDPEPAPGSMARRPVDEADAEGVGSPMGSSSAMWGAAGNPKDWLALAAIQFAIVSLAATLYSRIRLGNPFPQTAKTAEHTPSGFKYNLLSCHQDPKLSLFAFACPCLRWADTLEKANKKPLLPFYVAALLFTLLMILDPITAGVSLLVLVLVAIYFRQKLRAEFSLQTGGLTIWEDSLAYLCCFCCAIVQEARQVEKSRADTC